MRLTGHDDEGYGLCWSTIDEGKLLSGSDDSKICMWDINSGNTVGTVYKGHTDVVEVC